MSAEAAHQEAPPAKEATRDRAPPKADEPVAAGAALLAGGPRMLSPAYIASLQRLAGNAGLSSMLQPRRDPPVGPLPVQRDTLSDQVTSGQFKPALEFLNGRSIEDMLDRLEKLGFAMPATSWQTLARQPGSARTPWAAWRQRSAP